MADYRRATGFEALMGYLYLKEDFSRMLELIYAGLDGLDEKLSRLIFGKCPE
jgi:ribonuclease-3 family protein